MNSNVILGRGGVKPLVESFNHLLKLYINPLYVMALHVLLPFRVEQSINCSVPGIERIISFLGQRLPDRVSPVAFMYDARLGKESIFK